MRGESEDLMFPLLTCPNCGGLLSILRDSMTVVTSESGAMTLIAPLASHSCDPAKAYVMPND